jgi:bifunctional DNase/RNase
MGQLKKELSVVALSASESHPGNYALILEDTITRRRIPMIIGLFEAQAIAIAMERMQPARPMTHDLLKNSMVALGAKLQEVLIHSLQDGVFHASLLVQTIDKEILSIDARSSDAIALAVRFGAPIFAYEEVIEEAGLLSEIFLPNLKKGSLAEYNIAELEALLERVLEKEDFESAARIRDLIERRKGG